MTPLKNSNPVGINGTEITEGMRVEWCCQDDHTRGGVFVVDELFFHKKDSRYDCAILKREDGKRIKGGWNKAPFEELRSAVFCN